MVSTPRERTRNNGRARAGRNQWCPKTKTRQNQDERERDRREIERPSKREYEEEDFTATYDTRHVKAPIKTMMKEYWKTRKRVKVGEILDQANKRWQDLPESFQQKCLNHFLGKCTGPHRRTGRRCTFSHKFEDISDNDTAEMCRIIGPGVKRIVEAEQVRKRRRSD